MTFCYFEHETHKTERVYVDLRHHKFKDLPLVPLRLVVGFNFWIFQDALYRDLDNYCPARDVVSETIRSHGIWEPSETIMTLSACRAYQGETYLDFGAQLGWFSKLADLSGMLVVGIDADPANIEMLIRNVPSAIPERAIVDASFLGYAPQDEIAIVKIDIEGAENHAVRALEGHFATHSIKHALIECSPVFDDYYGSMISELVDGMGYIPYLVPSKRMPRWALNDIPNDLASHEIPERGRELIRKVDSWHQENVWLCSPDARWA